MKFSNPPVDERAAEQRLMRYLAVEGVSGHERAIGEAIIEDLVDAGVPRRAIRFDNAKKRIPLPTETGNLVAKLAGTRRGPALAFATHLDVVPICAGARPKRRNGRIVPQGRTGLGGDNRTGCAVLSTLAQTLLEHDLPHPPITLLYTVREETSLLGSRYLDPGALRGVSMCFNVDGMLAGDLITGAVGGQTWDAQIHGKAAHAGVAPEKGISSTLVASIALADAARHGWFGKVAKRGGRGTSNAGIFAGRDGGPAGDATNVVTDYVHVTGGTRSRDADFAATITEAYRDAFTKAAKTVKDDRGGTAKVQFEGREIYPPFNLDNGSEAVARAKEAARSIGLKPRTIFSNGGLDANWLVEHGVPTVTFGAGQHEIHTVNEYVDIGEFIDGCRMAVALATLE